MIETLALAYWLAQVPPSPELIAPLASFGGLGIAVWFMWIQLGKAEQRVKDAIERGDAVAATERSRADTAVANERALRDSIIKELVPAMTKVEEVARRQLEEQIRGARP